MKKYVLSFLAIFFSCALFGQDNPCPTISDVQIITTSTSGGNCARYVSIRIKNDVSNSNPKGVKVEVLSDGVNVTTTNCFIASTLTGGAIFTTTPATYSCSATPLIRITRYTASNGNCQGGTCGEVLIINPVGIRGSVNCTITSPRSYNLFIDSYGEVSGTYDVFIDKTADGVIDADELANYRITASAPFTTTLGGAASPFTYNFAITNNYGNGVIITPGLSAKNIIVKVNVTTSNASSNEKLIGNTCAGLPISLKYFNANQRNGKVALLWETDQENNNDGFEVQRRLGNGKYETIAFVDSKAPAGTGGAYAYSFDDNLSAANTVAYYRLRQVDLDGRSGFSEIRSIRNGSKQISVSVYPNPSRGATNVSIPEGSGMMDISLNDLTGKSVQRWNSVNMRSLQLNNLKPGIYMLRINFRETGDQVVERIVVQ